MKLNFLQILIVVVFLSFFSGINFAQQNRLHSKLKNKDQKQSVYVVFNQIENAILGNDVSVVANLLSPQTYFSLSNGISGYYSSNQAYYVLEDFFKIYRVTSFKLNNIQPDENNPYATGVYGYEFRGKRDAAQVYISLKNMGGSWKITQITIN